MNLSYFTLKLNDRVIVHPNICRMNASVQPTINSDMNRMGRTEDFISSTTSHYRLKNHEWQWHRTWLVKIPKSSLITDNLITRYTNLHNRHFGISFTGTVKSKTPAGRKQKEFSQTAVICVEAHNILASAHKTYKPTIFVLGADKKGIIKHAVRIKHGEGGCSQMPSVSQTMLATGVTELIKHKLSPVGIARIGTEAGYAPDFGGGSGINRRELPNSIVISFGYSPSTRQPSVTAYRIFPSDRDTNQIRMNYEIVN